jgi:hypothetical protein
MSIINGINRTGMDLSPIDVKEVIEAAEISPPSSPGSEQNAAELRADYARQAPTIGSVPPPGTLKGVLKAASDMVRGYVPSVLIDKLSERLAFERTGTRLYEALIAKLDGKGSFPGGPAREDLIAIRNEEASHVELLRRVMLQIGADPTAMTPAADVQGVASMGLLQVASDPRTTLAQGLDAVLIAELADNDGWLMLVDVARAFGRDDLVDDFNLARVEEERHLELVRRWVSDHAMLEIRGEAEVPHRKAA